MSYFTVVVKDTRGENHNWETIARSASQAVMAATELLPGFTIVSVHLKGEW